MTERGQEDVLDEVLSFNYRSLRDIFLRPGSIARVFLDGDRARYTPTMRVWFGVLTLLVGTCGPSPVPPAS